MFINIRLETYTFWAMSFYNTWSTTIPSIKVASLIICLIITKPITNQRTIRTSLKLNDILLFNFCIRENWLVKLTQGFVTNLKSRKKRSTRICFKMKKKLMAWGDYLIRWERISTKSTNLVRWLRFTIMDCEWIPTRITGKIRLTNLKFSQQSTNCNLPANLKSRIRFYIKM